METRIKRKVEIERISARGIRIRVSFPNLDFDGAAPDLLLEEYWNYDYYPGEGFMVHSGYFTSVEGATNWIERLSAQVQDIVMRAEQLIPEFKKLEREDYL